MKMTINELMTLQVSIIAMSQTKIPAYPAGSRFDRALRDVSSITAPAIADMQKLYRESGVLGEDGKQFVPPTEPEASAAFEAAQIEIRNREVEIDWHPVDEAELGAAMIEPAHITALRGYMINN